MVLDLLISIFIALGGLFGLVGSFGIWKLNDPMSRLHAPTKATTLGVGGVLIGSMIHALAHEGHGSSHELLITLFLLLTAPVTANFIAKAYINQAVTADELPAPDPDPAWATLNRAEAQDAPEAQASPETQARKDA